MRCGGDFVRALREASGDGWIMAADQKTLPDLDAPTVQGPRPVRLSAALRPFQSCRELHTLPSPLHTDAKSRENRQRTRWKASGEDDRSISTGTTVP